MEVDSVTVRHHTTTQKEFSYARGFLKVVVCADMNSQLVCAVMTRHNMQHDNPDFLPLLYKTNSIVPVDIVLGDMGFDDESNHVGARDIGAAAIIPTRYADVPIYRTSGYYRKEMKRNFPVELYHQRNKSETIFFVIKQIRPLAQLTQFDQSMQIYSQQDPKLRISSLLHANIQETSQKTEERSSHLLGLA